MKRIVVPEDVHIYAHPESCPHRGELLSDGKSRAGIFCTCPEALNAHGFPQKECDENWSGQFPDWCPLDDHNPDCPVVDPMDLLDQAADAQRKLIVALNRLISKYEGLFIEDVDPDAVLAHSHLLGAIEMAKIAIRECGGKVVGDKQ